VLVIIRDILDNRYHLRILPLPAIPSTAKRLNVVWSTAAPFWFSAVLLLDALMVAYCQHRLLHVHAHCLRALPTLSRGAKQRAGDSTLPAPAHLLWKKNGSLRRTVVRAGSRFTTFVHRRFILQFGWCSVLDILVGTTACSISPLSRYLYLLYSCRSTPVRLRGRPAAFAPPAAAWVVWLLRRDGRHILISELRR
jgi:hypothetical protein